jgi:hypothetical protein
MFAIKNLGDLHYFLGIEVHRSREEIVMSQTKYTSNIRLPNMYTYKGFGFIVAHREFEIARKCEQHPLCFRENKAK